MSIIVTDKVSFVHQIELSTVFTGYVNALHLMSAAARCMRSLTFASLCSDTRCFPRLLTKRNAEIEKAEEGEEISLQCEQKANE